MFLSFMHGISPSYGVPEAAGPLSALLFPAAHHTHAQRIGAGVHRNGAADLQQAHLTLCTGVLGTQGGTGLHPQALALVGVIAIAHRDAVVVRRAAVGSQIVHQLLQRLFKALLPAAGHAAGKDLAILEQDHRLDAQHVGCTARHLADAAALDEIVQIAYREEDLVGGLLCSW